VIEIEKKSGMNRARSEDKRMAALKAECAKQGFTLEQYEQFKREAAEQWYRKDGKIVIPRHQLAGAFVQAIGTSPKNLRGPFDKDNFRALIQIGDFETDRHFASGVFARFAKLEASNQRSYQENEYLGVYLDQGEPFEARGVFGIPNRKHVDTVRSLLEVVVGTTGIGASRKMGFGRGVVKEWVVEE
jgi:hypothetical protein